MRLFTSNPIAVQNVSFVSGFVLLGLAVYFLLHWVTRDAVAASVAGVAIALSPERYGQLGHVQMLHTAGFAVLLYALLAFVEDRRRSAGPLIAGALVFQALCSLYLGVMAATLAGIGIVFVIVGSRGGWSEVLRKIVPWIAVAGIVLLPIFIPYQRLAKELGYGGSLEDQTGNWASHKDYIRPLQGSLAARVVGFDLTLPRGRSAYLGLVFSLLAAAAAASASPSANARPSGSSRFLPWSSSRSRSERGGPSVNAGSSSRGTS